LDVRTQRSLLAFPLGVLSVKLGGVVAKEQEPHKATGPTGPGEGLGTEGQMMGGTERKWASELISSLGNDQLTLTYLD
jgi:hypothetical protein